MTYRAVARLVDCPPCSSPTVAGYLIARNDRMERSWTGALNIGKQADPSRRG